MTLSFRALLAGLERGLTHEQIREVRALTVLERLGSKSARSLLETLGKGAAGAYFTEEARLELRGTPERK